MGLIRNNELLYMEIHVLSTLAHVKVGRKERQLRQIIHTSP